MHSLSTIHEEANLLLSSSSRSLWRSQVRVMRFTGDMQDLESRGGGGLGPVKTATSTTTPCLLQLKIMLVRLGKRGVWIWVLGWRMFGDIVWMGWEWGERWIVTRGGDWDWGEGGGWDGGCGGRTLWWMHGGSGGDGSLVVVVWWWRQIWYRWWFCVHDMGKMIEDELRKKFKKAEKERNDLKLTLDKFQTSSKNLSKLLESQVSDKSGLGFIEYWILIGD
nr:hypothetical protein [Tanacetum cinerariifolium]